MKQYYKIGEISKIYSIGKDSLMYYEELGILKPTRDANGYRLYNITDIWRLNLIKELRALNLPMKVIKEYIDNRTIKSTEEFLYKEIELLDKKIEELKAQKENILKRIETIESVKNESVFDVIRIEEIEERKAFMLKGHIIRDEDIDFLMNKLQKEYEERFDLLGKNNIGAVFYLDKMKDGIYTEFKSVFCFLEDYEENYNMTLKKGKYLTYSYRGSYRNNKVNIPKLFEFIDENKYEICGDPIEIYKIDIHETGKVDEFITEIQIPVKIKIKG